MSMSIEQKENVKQQWKRDNLEGYQKKVVEKMDEYLDSHSLFELFSKKLLKYHYDNRFFFVRKVVCEGAEDEFNTMDYEECVVFGLQIAYLKDFQKRAKITVGAGIFLTGLFGYGLYQKGYITFSTIPSLWNMSFSGRR